MADALASGASVLRDVGVQVPLRPHLSGSSDRTRPRSSRRVFSKRDLRRRPWLFLSDSVGFCRVLSRACVGAFEYFDTQPVSSSTMTSESWVWSPVLRHSPRIWM